VKALVIGGTGPTGPVVVEGLSRRGYDVTILHSGKHEVEFAVPVEHIHGEPHFLEPLKNMLEGRTFDLVIGMYGRLRYLAEAIKGKTPRFIAVGGMPYEVFVEGNNAKGGAPVLIKEDAGLFRDEKKNKFTYMMTLSEENVMEAHREGHYNATILRFPMIYGPRQVAPREWCIIRRVLDGRKRLIIPDGGLKLERRGYIDNVAQAVFLAADKPEISAGQTYNVGDEVVWSVREWATLIAGTMDHQWELVSMPFTLARPSRPFAGRDFHWLPDIDKIRSELGYKDQVPPHEGMRRTIAWYLENRPEPNGEIERALDDPFDYATEDMLVEKYETLIHKIREELPRGYHFHHAYDHPKEE
jgi:nucleoside-diphosphate-sugar epimerase